MHSHVHVEPFMFGKQRKKRVPIVQGVACPQLPGGAAPCRIQPLPGSVRGGFALVALFSKFLCCGTIGGEHVN